jgi:hypothetical protein
MGLETAFRSSQSRGVARSVRQDLTSPEKNDRLRQTKLRIVPNEPGDDGSVGVLAQCLRYDVGVEEDQS